MLNNNIREIKTQRNNEVLTTEGNIEKIKKIKYNFLETSNLYDTKAVKCSNPESFITHDRKTEGLRAQSVNKELKPKYFLTSQNSKKSLKESLIVPNPNKISTTKNKKLSITIEKPLKTQENQFQQSNIFNSNITKRFADSKKKQEDELERLKLKFEKLNVIQSELKKVLNPKITSNKKYSHLLKLNNYPLSKNIDLLNNKNIICDLSCLISQDETYIKSKIKNILQGLKLSFKTNNLKYTIDSSNLKFEVEFFNQSEISNNFYLIKFKKISGNVVIFRKTSYDILSKFI